VWGVWVGLLGCGVVTVEAETEGEGRDRLRWPD
jgi:hypothetical protein